jgi:hypothetical protein
MRPITVSVMRLLLALWITSAPAWSQQTASDSADVAASASDPNALADAVDSAAPVPAPARADVDPAADTDPEASPLDYEASEQISEDLSVSFPVDI